MSKKPDRTKFIGGSDAAAILGISPWKSLFQLYQEKTGAYVEEITPAKQRIFDRGHRWEPIVLEMLVDELQDRGHSVEVIATNERYQDDEHPFLESEIDAELLIDGEEVNAEMKTASHFAAGGWGDYNSEDIPIYYASQGMHGLMIKPRSRTVFAALTGFDERPMIRWMERDEETIKAIRAKEIAFWQRVQDRNPPEPETAEDVKWLYQRDYGLTIEADDELIDLCNELKGAKATAKVLDTQIELLSTRLKRRMAEAATLLGYDGKPLATWKNNKDSVKTDWKGIVSAINPPPEIIQSHTTTTAGARPLIIK